MLEDEILDRENSLLTCSQKLCGLKQGQLTLQETVAQQASLLEKYRGLIDLESNSSTSLSPDPGGGGAANQTKQQSIKELKVQNKLLHSEVKD